jgi:uncharacterized protein YaiI (UPF0178 family)
MTEFELMDGPLIQLADDGKTVVHNGKDVKKLKNRWTLGQLSDEELLNESVISMERYPNEKMREKIEKLKERKKMHQEEFKTFVDELKDYLSTKKGGRKKTKTYKKRSNKKKSIKKGRHSRRRRY